MMIGDADPLFLDTNILVYANILSAPHHQKALDTIYHHEQAGRELWISRQVLPPFQTGRVHSFHLR
jgi:predicted nucleic acid-binding protein